MMMFMMVLIVMWNGLMQVIVATLANINSYTKRYNDVDGVFAVSKMFGGPCWCASSWVPMATDILTWEPTSYSRNWLSYHD